METRLVCFFVSQYLFPTTKTDMFLCFIFAKIAK